MKRNTKYLIILGSYITFLIMTITIKGGGYSNWISYANTFIVFMFAIFLAFSISNRRDRIMSLRESLRELDGVTISLYNYSKAFDDVYSKKLLGLIDEYLILQIDTRISDFKITQESFMKIYEYVSSTKAKNDTEQGAKVAMMSDLESAIKLREKVEFLIADEMQPYEWITIIALALLTILSAFSINDGSWISLIVLPVIESVVVVIFITISDLDSLKWQEQNWIWEPLSALFVALGLEPYFPDITITQNRIPASLLAKLKSYRVGHHPSEYPVVNDRTIETVTSKKVEPS